MLCKTLLPCILAVLTALFNFFGGGVGLAGTTQKPLSERIGVTHWGAQYEPFLDEYGSGMRSAMVQLKQLGTKVVKLSTLRLEEVYPFDDWGGSPTDTLTNVLKHPTYKQFLDDPFFTTYFLSAYETEQAAWWDGLDRKEEKAVVRAFFDATMHLLKTYAGTGKTFILQNWEADNALGYVYSDYPGTAVQGMTDYLNARQKGIRLARLTTPRRGVLVFGGIEVNFLKLTPPGGVPRVVDAIVPRTNADIYLYSCWETKDFSDIGDNGEESNRAAIRQAVTDALACLNEKAPPSIAFGTKNVAISEFGYPEAQGERAHPGLDGDDWQRMVAQAVTEAGLAYGAQYMVYWELYCNDDGNGYWLIRPDGTKCAAYDYFHGLLR